MRKGRGEEEEVHLSSYEGGPVVDRAGQVDAERVAKRHEALWSGRRQVAVDSGAAAPSVGVASIAGMVGWKVERNVECVQGVEPREPVGSE